MVTNFRLFIEFFFKNNFIYGWGSGTISVVKTGGSGGKRQVIMAFTGWAKHVLQRGLQ